MRSGVWPDADGSRRGRRRRYRPVAGAVVACAVLAAGVSVALAGGAPVVADESAVTGVETGTATCTTDDAGFCTLAHRLGTTPAAVVVTLVAPQGGAGPLPSQLAADRYTATGFRVRALTAKGEAYTGSLTVGYAAYPGGAPAGASVPPPTVASAPASSPAVAGSPSRPAPSSAGDAGSGDAVAGCPAGGQLSGVPSGNQFAGHTYNGHGQTLPRGNYTIGSGTCIENYVFDGSNLTLAGSPSNVTIVNNLFQNWPARQAIANVNGTDITVNYNTVKASAGGAWTGIFGQGAMRRVTIAHNDIQNLGAAVDGIQLRFTGTGTDIEIAYNRITDNGRFPIELQQVAHGLKVHHNYATVRRMGGDQLGQLSIATGNDKDGGGYYDADTSGVEIAYNIVVNTDGSANPACFESRGNGNVLHDNYCRNYSYVDDYAMTNNSSPTPWYVTDNVLVGPGTGAVSIYEGFNRAGHQYVAPTERGNKRYAMGDPNAPGVPAWNYAAGVTTPSTGS
ncbi:hypothetical protein KZZ52_27965 [Dactylosporangium sp. AC04546]|uniref:right-handed parallel beta-helix repeat-containing protein n=1 Tax=Dactylosporangium sp. AC04546 TaxID=2862460 RepID=UPI001EE064CF|nr:right-handed parallel beta-helix repeat-containing protein [Dactylosporangium sp. AC04546]WVK89104.1 hypothetical protein KZZ52_27965 [Dactylosporangium sp. AC04546]